MKELGRVKERYEFSLDSRQLGVAVFGALALAALLFVLGMSVGRQWERKIEASAGPSPAAPATPTQAPPPESVVPTAPPAPPVQELVEAVETADAPAPEAKPPDAAGKPAKPEKEITAEELTFPKTLVSGNKKTEPLSASGSSAGPKPQTLYAVQVGAYKDKASAQHTARAMRDKGYEARTSEASGSGLYRVLVGEFKTREEAEAMSRRVEQKEKLKPYVTSYR